MGVSGGSKAAHRSSESRAAAMAHLKAVRDAQVCGDVYSDMATVTSSAGESRNQNHMNVFAVSNEVYYFDTDEEMCIHMLLLAQDFCVTSFRSLFN